MKTGFLSFGVAAVLLFYLVAAGLLISGSMADYSYERFRAMQVQELGIKNAFYNSVSGVAAASFSAYDSCVALPSCARLVEGISREDFISLAIFLHVSSFQEAMADEGFDVVFWCGNPSDSERVGLTSKMKEKIQAIPPSGGGWVSGKVLPGFPNSAQMIGDAQSAMEYFSQSGFPAIGQSCKIGVNSKERAVRLEGFGFSYYSPGIGMGRTSILPPSYEVDF